MLIIHWAPPLNYPSSLQLFNRSTYIIRWFGLWIRLLLSGFPDALLFIFRISQQVEETNMQLWGFVEKSRLDFCGTFECCFFSLKLCKCVAYWHRLGCESVHFCVRPKQLWNQSLTHDSFDSTGVTPRPITCGRVLSVCSDVLWVCKGYWFVSLHTMRERTVCSVGCLFNGIPLDGSSRYTVCSWRWLNH